MKLELTFAEATIVNTAIWALEKMPPRNRRLHGLFKVLWFANLDHIKRHGLPLFPDNFLAMRYGPVPSVLFRFFEKDRCPDAFKGYFERAGEKGEIRALRPCDESYLSETAKESIERSIAENGDLSFNDAVDKSHGEAWKAARSQGENVTIRMNEILDEIGASDELRREVMEDLAARSAL